ncbi:hypothetical protein ACFV6F_14455 [Kitasatospora phosalacinea]|uniref:hypothetical protein n=1 Tax=Kitasatospora phosalacinea TaxID=2065 RepID=UPI00365A28FF
MPSESPFSVSVRFYPGKVIVSEDRVVIRRSLLARLGGAENVTIPVADIVNVVSEVPTPVLNGYTFFETRGPSGSRALPDGTPRRKTFASPHTVAFTAAQKGNQQKLLEAVEFARARLRGE